MTTITVLHHSAFDLDDPATLVLDLANPKPKEVLAIHEVFVADMRANADPGKLPVKTGWNEITPAIAINLLRRNHPGMNRWLDPGTVFYYANQMANDDWKATGQPILLSATGKLLDAQHRLMAGLISGKTFKSYVVTDVEDVPGLFVYIDNGRTRTAAAALQTAGFDGVASVIARVLRFAEEVRVGCYNPSGVGKLPRLSPAQILNLAGNYPNVQKAARSAASDWADAVTYLNGRKDVISYVGMRIIDLHGEEVADDFFEDIMDTTAAEPVAAFRKEIDKDNRQPKQMKRQHVAATLILAFNAWIRNQPLGRRWQLAVNEDFPTLADSAAQAEAAE